MSDGNWLVSAEDASRCASLSYKEVFGEVMCDLARHDPNLTVVVSDYGRRLGLDALRERHPQAYVQVGIAEQNQVEVASAMANEGFVVFAPAYASFISSRALDQVRVNLGIMRSPVIIVGLSCGCDSGALGASHMALEDMGCMRQIPGMTVVSPADNAEFAAVLRELAQNPRPAYVRMNDEPGFSLRQQDVLGAPGHSRLLRTCGQDGAIIVATGTIVAQALGAADILAAAGISCAVLEMPTISPLDVRALQDLPQERPLVTLEEHGRMGGLGSAVAEWMADTGRGGRLLRLGMPDHYLKADVRERLLSCAGIDGKGAAAAIGEWLG